MYRFLSAAVGVIIAATTFEVAAQAPARAPAVPRTTARAVVPSGNPLSSGLVPRLLPGTRLDVFTRIQGNALNPTNGALPDTVVRLRDARVGRILDTEITDKAGLFAFGSFDPGLYIVELVGDDQSILAASQMLSVSAGEVVSAVVKLPFGIPPLGGFLGHTVQSASAVSSAAAASGVLAAKVTTQITPQ